MVEISLDVLVCNSVAVGVLHGLYGWAADVSLEVGLEGLCIYTRGVNKEQKNH